MITLTNETRILILQILLGVCLVLRAVSAVCRGVIFHKANENGLKVLIPFCNDFTACRITWSSAVFFVRLLVGVIACILFLLSGSRIYSRIGVLFNALSLPFLKISFDRLPFTLTGRFQAISTLLFCVFTAAGFMTGIIRRRRLSKAFGHGFSFFLGLLFFPAVFLSILAFGSREHYIGPNGQLRIETIQDLR